MSDDPIIKELNAGLERVSDNLEKQVSELDEKIDKQIDKVDEQIKLNGEAHQEDKEALNTLQDSYKALKERLDAVEKSNGRLSGGGDGQAFSQMVSKAIEDNTDKLKALHEERSGSVMLDIKTDMKSYTEKATMTQAADWTGDIVEPSRVPGIKYSPENRRVRQFLPQGSTDSNAIAYVEETAHSDNTATVAEGANIPENDLDIELKTANVRKIGTTFRIGRESLDDYAALSSHISLRGTQKYYLEENDQILYGDDTGQNLAGLTTTATDYTLDNYTGDANANEWDILAQSVKQLTTNNYMPTAAMMSWSRFVDMVLAKDADGEYLMPEAVRFGMQMPRVLGVPIVPVNSLNDDDFLVAEFPQLTTIFDRRGVQVRFFEEDRDNVQKDLITVQITGRLAMPTYLPGAGRYGDFASAITNAGNS